MKLILPAFVRDRRRGLALIIVITTISLISVLVVAIFSITRTEFKATQGFVTGRSAKQLADIGTAIVQAQIQNAQNTNTAATTRTIHATQPGMVRVYNAIGTFVRAHKLYSSTQMTVAGGTESALFGAAHQVPANWNSDENKGRFVDLNDPVIRPARTAGSYSVYFPIIDPRAAYNTLGTQTPTGTAATTQVEGFAYSKSTPAVGANAALTYNEVVLPTEVNNAPNKLRLPMPVEWLYVLQDGTTGTLNESNEFVSSNPQVTPSPTNPIVGRIAFWTDDECCKINVNTASEPTFFAPPFFYHARDHQWASFPPAAGEYQRYPGHPAMVALSSVFAPRTRLDPMANGANVNRIVATKELIYDLAPKIAKGGSKAGTLPFVQDDFSSARGEASTTAQVGEAVSAAAAARMERLYSSVDDMLFKEGPYDGNGRLAARFTLEGSSPVRSLYDRETLEKSRFFLTAHSRAPEFSVHGLPRVSMWPLADETLGQDRRTSFDNMIALCSTLKPATSGAAIANSYAFRRAQPHHPTHDVTGTSSAFGSSNGLQRNSKLLNYLYQQMAGLNFPGTSSSGTPATTFAAKYGTQNVAQLAVEFFDYIRSTNLYDGVLARENDGIDGAGPNGTALYTLNDAKQGTALTYTNHRVTRKAAGSLNAGSYRQGSDIVSDNSKVFPGHGTVTPAVWQGPSGVTAPSAEGQTNAFRGFGRMFTLSEVGFQFVCTADGKDDEFAITVNGRPSGGGSAPRADPTNNVTPRGAAVQPLQPQPNQLGNHRRWYSNYPPLLPKNGIEAPGDLYGCVPTPGSPNHPSNHPGYDPLNWNMTLENQTPLAQNQKRVQAMVVLEAFCPMLGWTKMFPEYSIVFGGDFIGQLKLNGQALFDTTQDVEIKSNDNLYESHDVYSLGGHAGPTAFAGNRGSRPISGNGAVLMPSDAPQFDLDNTTGHNGLTNYALSSNFITVPRDAAMVLTAPNAPLEIRIYDTHMWRQKNLQPIQRIFIRFDSTMTLPVPALAYSMQRLRGGQPVATQPQELNTWYEQDQFGRLIYQRSLQGPHWWCLNYGGCLGRLQGQVNPLYDGDNEPPLWTQVPARIPPGQDDTALRQALRGRLDTAAGQVTPPPGTAQGFSIIPFERDADGMTDADTGDQWSGTDVIRTMVPAVGDYRLIAGRYVVPSSMWKKHPVWEQEQNKGLRARKTIHSFTTHWAETEPGVVLGASGSRNLLVADAVYANNRRPDLPASGVGGNDWAAAANSFGDFDNGIANSRDGPWINKPDEGNFYAGNFNRHNQTRFYRSGYFYEPWHNSDDWRTGVYMTPNRMVTSPVMFGSLSTGVYPGGNVPNSALATSGTVTYTEGRPWQTLLFRPYVPSHNSVAKTNHPGNFNPRDHYLLDLFSMPVVEPYAISEPLSTAGKVNLNYQIMPFTNIRRATAMHALMKGEFMTTIPKNADVNNAKSFRSGASASEWTGGRGDQYFDEKTSPDKKFWHRPINIDATLGQFDNKFNLTSLATVNSNTYAGLFRAASQICEMHLIPDITHGSTSGTSNQASDGGEVLTGVTSVNATSTGAQVLSSMSTFWQNHSPTGDNTRERPYANLYPRVTTRTNTFRVHVRAQVIRKARSVAANEFDPAKDAVTGEYRGSALLERFIDPTNSQVTLPDYADAANPLTQVPLDAYYQFRVLESKRFSP